ncbi:Pyrroline-5-carboxylate reductase [termite gut metagenome]|uniref:Pyrroline-5-carboxylate reductase n=1 Tax=termite gut metagenome TaxID=433724 RepID=A0A5J4QRU8_9ZZZZ
MKVAIIGAGNMGGSIARGFTQGTLIKAENIIVSDPNNGMLEALKVFNPNIQTTNSNQEAINHAEIILIAVKPWLVREVVGQLTFDFSKQMIVSIAAGVPFSSVTKI